MLVSLASLPIGGNSDVFVATIYVEQGSQEWAIEAISPKERFDKPAVAINTGNNLFSVPTLMAKVSSCSRQPWPLVASITLSLWDNRADSSPLYHCRRQCRLSATKNEK